jgi:hypothetical protein
MIKRFYYVSANDKIGSKLAAVILARVVMVLKTKVIATKERTYDEVITQKLVAFT